MTSQRTILVTGATGKVGGEVVRQLLQAGASVRALVRDPDRAELDPAVDVRAGDLSRAETVEAAARGADAAFLVWPFLTSEDAPAVLGAFAQHVRQVVYQSAMGLRPEPARQDAAILQFHADLERLLRASGMGWTFVRGGGFAGNTLGWAEQIKTDGVVQEPYAAGSRPLVHEADLAAVAVHALLEDGHDGTTYDVTGPAYVSVPEQVDLIGRAIGRELRFEEITPEAARQRMLDQQWPAEVADELLAAAARMEHEREPITSTVETLTGRPARTFARWARDHAADFR